MVDNAKLEKLSHEQLLALAEARGIKLPNGYVKVEKLIKMLRAAAKPKAAQ